jgi:pyridinium-3,5-biscarboxylic acid mononucleotide sulfurtransferase
MAIDNVMEQQRQDSDNTIPSLDEPAQLQLLEELLGTIRPRVIACSGGIDSMLLATLAHRQSPPDTIVAHAVSPAVPAEATARVRQWARRESWNLQVVSSGEFSSEDYLSNPVNRCYYCKSNLYKSLDQLANIATRGATLMSGANMNDLGEYRPGLIAAQEKQVRHPYVESDIDKAGIRAIARFLGLPFAELAASPCLASRLYTGTRVTPERLKAIEEGESFLRRETGIDVLRCRVREQEMSIEVSEDNRRHITPTLLQQVEGIARRHEPGITRVQLDPQPYRAGRAFLVTP